MERCGSLTGVEDADDDILAGFVEGRQPFPAVGRIGDSFLEAQKLPRPRGVRRPPPLAPEGRHHLTLLCRHHLAKPSRISQTQAYKSTTVLAREENIQCRISSSTLFSVHMYLIVSWPLPGRATPRSHWGCACSCTAATPVPLPHWLNHFIEHAWVIGYMKFISVCVTMTLQRRTEAVHAIVAAAGCTVASYLLLTESSSVWWSSRIASSAFAPACSPRYTM